MHSNGTVRQPDNRSVLNKAVKAGQLLVEIDDADYQAMLKESEAALAGARAEYSANQEAKRAADASVEASHAGIEQAQAAIAAARAGIEATRASLTQSESEFARQQALLPLTPFIWVFVQHISSFEVEDRFTSL